MSTIAEMNYCDLEQKTENHGYKLEINEKETRAKHFQYEARVMSEASKTLEEAATGLQKQSKEEQQQLKEANLALAEANKILKRESLLKVSAVNGREKAVLEEKLQELEENLRHAEKKHAEKKLLEVRSENAKMKAEMRHGPTRDDSRDGRGLLTSRSKEEDHSRLKEDIKHQESGVHRLRKERDEVYDWYTEAFDSYGEEPKEAQEYENMNAELRYKPSEKEESKIKAPPWPKVNDLGLWKANLIQAIVIAANDSDQQPWIDWIREAVDDPDPDRLLDSGDLRFHSIDAKLGLALTKVVSDSKEEGNNVAIMTLRAHINARGRTSTLIKGRDNLSIDPSQLQDDIQR